MPVSTPYDEHDERALDWATCRDVFAGPRRVKEAGTTYLPKPAGMALEPDGGKAAYNAYVERADFFNGYGRAIDGLHGMVFRRETEVVLPEAMSAFRTRATKNGRSIERLARWVMRELLVCGRVGLFVDFAPMPNQGRVSRAVARDLGAAPHISAYPAEDVIHLGFGDVDGRRMLTSARVVERFKTPSGEDEWSTVEVSRVRVLDLDEDGFYRQRIYEAEEGSEHDLVETIEPLMAARRLRFVPFMVVDADGEPDDGSIAQPPMLDLALKTLSLYRTLADLEHLAYFVGHPQPCVKMPPAEWREAKTQVRIGGGELWTFDDPQADAWYMTHDGRGSETLEKLADRKRQEMALLGARMLEPDRRAVEAAATAMIHRQGEVSVLQSLALLASEGLTWAVDVARQWIGASGEVKVELNTDYVPTGATPAMVGAMLKARIAGEITREVWYKFLGEGEVVTLSQSFEEFERALADEGAEEPPEPIDLDDMEEAAD